MNSPARNIATLGLPAWVITAFLLLGSCQQQEHTPEPENAHRAYQQNVLDTLSSDKQRVRQWITASEKVLEHPVSLTLPFQIKSIYDSDESNAWGWEFSARKGRFLQTELKIPSSEHTVFMDLFTLSNGDTLLVASSNNNSISYRTAKPGSYILRLQTKLDISGSFMLKITDRPSMEFPVAGGRPYDIGGQWGDPRDGGNRYHNGVDIFSEKHASAVAAADGWIGKTGINKLGGKVIWLNTNGKSLYYAHLDSFLIEQGQAVEAGDTLGLVGTSGNAKSTPPHLHFGIYDYYHSVDPQPFIDDTRIFVKSIKADPSVFNKWGSLQTNNVAIRPDPSTEHPALATLNNGDSVKVIGGTGTWYHIRFGDGKDGFINQRFMEPASSITTARTGMEHAQ